MKPPRQGGAACFLFNARAAHDAEALQELRASVAVKGLLQPILVKALEGERYMIVAGERRYRAHQLLARPTIAAVVTEGDMDKVAIIENVQRENLRPMELAKSLGRLMETHGYTQEDAAKVIGKARNTVTELLSLLKLPEAIKAQCRTSDIASKSFLMELARMDADAMWSAWDALKAKGESWTSTLSARLRCKGLNEPYQITPRDNGIHLIQKFALAGALGFDGEFRWVKALLFHVVTCHLPQDCKAVLQTDAGGFRTNVA